MRVHKADFFQFFLKQIENSNSLEDAKKEAEKYQQRAMELEAELKVLREKKEGGGQLDSAAQMLAKLQEVKVDSIL